MTIKELPEKLGTKTRLTLAGLAVIGATEIGTGVGRSALYEAFQSRPAQTVEATEPETSGAVSVATIVEEGSKPAINTENIASAPKNEVLAKPAVQDPKVTIEKFDKGTKIVLEPNCGIEGDVSYTKADGSIVFAPGESNANIGTILLTDEKLNVEFTNAASKACATSKEEINKWADTRAIEMQLTGQGCLDGCKEGVNIVTANKNTKPVKIEQAGKGGPPANGGAETPTPTATATPTSEKKKRVIEVEICEGEEVTIIAKCVECEEKKATPTPTPAKAGECPPTDFEVKPGDTRNIKKGDIVQGDIKVKDKKTGQFVRVYDEGPGSEKTGAVTIFNEEDTEVFFQWGGDVFRACSANTNKDAFDQQVKAHLEMIQPQLKASGCDKGCDRVDIQKYPEEIKQGPLAKN